MAVHRLRETLSWRAVGDEIVVLDLQGAEYFSVSGAGVVLWESLREGATVAQLVSVVCDAFAVEPERATADVEAFLAELGGMGLLR